MEKPEEKAKEILQSFINQAGGEDFEQLERGRQCALIAVDLVIDFSNKHTFSIREDNDFWKAVKDWIARYKPF